MAKVEFTGRASDFLKIGVAAAGRGDLDAVRAILKARPHWLKHEGSHGRTMLWEASHRGKLNVVKYLVKRKADINACGSYYTPYFVEVSCLCIARLKKRVAVAEFLQSANAKYDIFSASFLGDVKTVRKFLKRDKTLVSTGHPQHVMAGKNDQGLDVRLAPAPWATPLCYAMRGYAIQRTGMETVELLIEQKSQIRGNEDSLFNAADGNCEMVRLLLENGADPALGPEVFPDEGALYEIVSAYGVRKPGKETLGIEFVYLCRGDRGGNPEDVQRLIDLGVDVNFRDKKGKTALHRAAKAGFFRTIAVLLDNGAHVDSKDADDGTPLMDGVRSTIRDPNKKSQAIKALLAAGAKPKYENRKGESALSLAQTGRHASREIEKLLSKPAARRKR